jgi:hypothetical protein
MRHVLTGVVLSMAVSSTTASAQFDPRRATTGR